MSHLLSNIPAIKTVALNKCSRNIFSIYFKKKTISFELFLFQVIQKGHGLLHVARAPITWGPKDYTSYLPCDLCLVWYKDQTLHRHRCTNRKDGKKPSLKNSKRILASAIGGITQGMASILSSFVQDEVAAAVQGDEVLLAILRAETESEAVWRAKKVCKYHSVRYKGESK